MLPRHARSIMREYVLVRFPETLAHRSVRVDVEIPQLRPFRDGPPRYGGREIPIDGGNDRIRWQGTLVNQLRQFLKSHLDQGIQQPPAVGVFGQSREIPGPFRNLAAGLGEG